MKSNTRLQLIGASMALALFLGGCGQKNEGAGAGAAGGPPGGGMPPPPVGVITVQPESTAWTTDLPGRLDPWRVAQVRARVAGVVLKRVFREGSDVKAGQVLYQVDPAPYQATLNSALAAVARTEATLVQVRSQAERYKPLVEANAVSKQDYIAAVAAQKQAEADLQSNRAAVQTARINLGYATVTSPIAGRVGAALVTEGALVGQGEATPMAVVQQIDPLYVNFTQSTSELLRLRKLFDSGKLKRAGGGEGAEVRILLDDGSVYEHAGKLLFSGWNVDPSSGQITLRAEVPNPGHLLLPGMYVRVRIEQARDESAILLPQQAVTRGSQGDTAMVVDDKGNVSVRPLRLGSAQGNRWIVLDGLKPGEQVIVDGFQKMRPGAPVTPVPWTKAQGRPAGAAPGGATQGGAPGADGKAAAGAAPGQSK